MEVTAVRPQRVRALVAVAAVLGVLGLATIQCALLSGKPTVPHAPHVLAAAQGPTSPTDVIAGHAHVGDASTHIVHALQPVTVQPRSDNPLRLVGVVGAAVAMVVFTVLSLHSPSRGPPTRQASARSGRTVLEDICICRC